EKRIKSQPEKKASTRHFPLQETQSSKTSSEPENSISFSAHTLMPSGTVVFSIHARVSPAPLLAVEHQGKISLDTVQTLKIRSLTPILENDSRESLWLDRIIFLSIVTKLLLKNGLFRESSVTS